MIEASHNPFDTSSSPRGSRGDPTRNARAIIAGFCFVLAFVWLAIGSLMAQEIFPAKTRAAGGETLGVYSERTLAVAISVDRAGASLIAFTLKPRAFERALALTEAKSIRAGEGVVQLEIALLGPRGETYTQRVDVAGLCFDHDADSPPHIAGDTIQLHRESLVVEVPDLPDFERLDVAYHADREGVMTRVDLGVLPLTSDRFTSAGGTLRDTDRASAAPIDTPATGPQRALQLGPGSAVTPSGDTGASATARGSTSSSLGLQSSEPQLLTPGTVHWPEEFGDADKLLIFGGGDPASRINIVIVPDGYTYAQKSTMLLHAQSLVNAFRAKTPYKEHDAFINYILVYAYSTESGTDQCDCSIVRDTAMATRFPQVTPTTPCQSSDNRCLFYGSGNGGPNCDPNVSTVNISAAELRAPARDATLIMVNTTRYGGCGGSRAVYSAGNASATEIAMHELGHSIAGLADEYGGTVGCGSIAGEVNTSRDPIKGAWPEWIDDIGPPHEGAQYYNSCLYRPEASCEMATLGPPFCHVCNQRWALRYFGHFRISPSAPITSMAPATPVQTQIGLPTPFSVQTRLATGPAVTNGYTWRLLGPGDPVPTTVFTGGPAYTPSFSAAGSYYLTSAVTADTNFIKPLRNGANVDTVGWDVNVTEIPEVSDDPVHELTASRNAIDPSKVDIRFENVGSSRYNLYVSVSPQTNPFAVSDPAMGKKACAVSGLSPGPGGSLELTGYDLAAGLSGNPSVIYFLVTADNGPATEGSLGDQHLTPTPSPRTADSYCSR